MTVRLRSSGSGAVVKAARACGSVVVKDLPEAGSTVTMAEIVAPGPAETHARGILVEASDSPGRPVAAALNGDREMGRRGFYVNTYDPDKVLYIPFHVTADWDEALRICRREGLLCDRLNEMPLAQANACYYLALATVEPVN